jgi:pyruvate formate-lyase activating enzyme-like uncharacterized protein
MCKGNLQKAGALCVKGKKMVLFITDYADRDAFCPVSEDKFSKDVIFANEWEIKKILKTLKK